MMFESWAVSLVFFVVVTVVLVVVDPPVVVALLLAAGVLSTGAVVTDVDDDTATVSAVDCLAGVQPPSATTAAVKESFAMVVIDCPAGSAY